MKIVVTGALGHIGSRLIRELPFLFPGSAIVMVDNMITQRYCSLFDLPAEGNYRFIEADVTKMDLQTLLEDADVVVHLAAMTDAAGSFGHADELEQNNFNATKRIAEACAGYNTRLIALSSTSVYGTQASVVDEDCTEDELKPQSPYATTKLREERLVQQLCNERGLEAVIFRFGTIFGTSPGMRFHTAVNRFCWQAVMGQPLTVWKTAYEQKRPYLDLSDAVRAVAFVIENSLFDGEIYNVVTVNVTVRGVVEHIRQHVPQVDVHFVNNQIMNQLSYEVLNTRMTNAGFHVQGDIGEGIATTVELLMGG
ncbi:MAG: SDR family oxidoreductase [Mariprofundales bacterium]|nr:SDR family oxidoreductase [Mariprofundales bacterium]